MMENHLKVELAVVLSEIWFEDAWEWQSGGAYPYITEDNGDVRYTESAQDCFNEVYSKVDGILNQYIKTKG